VETGDLGPKFGIPAKDNGWAHFNNVRIPRRQMLMNMCKVERDGSFSLVGDPRGLYASMMLIRSRIVHGMHYYMMFASCICLRYAAVRRQFQTIENSKEERRIINYQTFQHKIVPILAKAYASCFVGIFTR
jgi:alkylation response protein AidB-like acyl-CoA dehydrogenase